MTDLTSTSVFSCQSHKANVRRLRKQVVHRFWDYIDDFEDWRCLDAWCALHSLAVAKEDHTQQMVVCAAVRTCGWLDAKLHMACLLAYSCSRFRTQIRLIIDVCDQSAGTVSIQSWPKATLDTRLRLYIMAEIVGEIHEQVPLVQRIFDVIEDKGAVLVISELPGHGTLWDVLLASDTIDHIPWLVCEVLVPLMVVLHHMHDSGVMHRNVTPGAVLFQKSGSAFIGAFKVAARSSDVNFCELETPLHFSAPEMLLCCAYDNPLDKSNEVHGSFKNAQKPFRLSYSYPVDVWALGVTLYLCLTGRLPFIGDEDDPEALYNSILFAEPHMSSDIDPAAADFIRQCLKKQPGDRPDIKQLLAHELITRHINWTAAPHERLPDEHYTIPRSPRTPIQKSMWERVRSKIVGTERGFPLAIINNGPMQGAEAKENVFSQRPQESARKDETELMENGFSVPKVIQKSPQSCGPGMADQLHSHNVNNMRKRASIDTSRSSRSFDRPRLTEHVEKKIASKYDLSALRALDDDIVSQLDLSEEATAVAMKRLSMWQEEDDSGSKDTRSRPPPSGLLVPLTDNASATWVNGPGTSGSHDNVERLMTWSRSFAQNAEDQSTPARAVSQGNHHRRNSGGSRGLLKEDSLAGLMDEVDVVDQDLS